MSVLIYTENVEGKFKKYALEAVSYGASLAEKLGTGAIALSIGEVTEDELSSLGKYGAGKIIRVSDSRLEKLENAAYAKVISEVARKVDAKVVVFASNNTGKALAPRVAVALEAGFAGNAMSLPVEVEPLVFKKTVFNGKAIGYIKLKSEKAVLTLARNSFGIHEYPKDVVIESMEVTLDDSLFASKVTDTHKITGKILLTDAEVVVSGGRGMKSADNGGPLEEFAEVLGAATACSRPVSDEGWRPHEEHTGQTGKIIAPNVYFALGISGAVQHVAGVSGSKIIVAVNTDKEAPIFEVADYGIVGDVMKVLPQLIEAAKELKEG